MRSRREATGGLMHFLFPNDPRHRSRPEDFFAEQADALAAVGFGYSTFGSGVPNGTDGLPELPPAGRVVYRGWMLDTREYEQLEAAIVTAGGVPFTSREQYLAAHHLPNWYRLIPDLTPETRIYPVDADLVAELNALGWDAYFVKDYVKSLKTSIGSLIHDPAMIDRVVAELKSYRGDIEGGVCVRRVEDFLPETETRYFVIAGKALAPDGGSSVPDIVSACAARVPSPFFSVDVVRRRDGALRVVEVGDGQVSDLVGWSPEAFAEIWRQSAPASGTR
jgi:hypothetical protein